MGRDRSRDRRSRSPDRSRKRSRSRSRDRGRWEDPDPTVAQMQALAAMEAQAQLQRQMMAQQGGINSLLNAGVAIPGLTAVVNPTPIAQTIGAASSTAARKAREVYIGNLCIGTVSAEMLREFFNAALAGLVPDPLNQPPVIEVKMDATGRYAFVELRTEELATTAMNLDKTELAGRQMNIGRPKGYVPGYTAPVPVASHDKLGLAQQLAAQLAGGVTNVVLLEGMLPAGLMRDQEEKREVLEMVYEECMRCGKVLGIAVPLPPEGGAADDQPCRAYIKYNVSAEATKCKEMMDGRLFDDSKVKATYATEVDYNRAAAGEWIVEGEVPAAAAGPVAVPIGAPSGAQKAPLSVPALGGSLPGLGMGLPSFMPGLIPGLSFPPPPP